MTRDELLQKVKEIMDRASKEAESKRAQGICIEPECQKPALKDNSTLFFGQDHCEEHARAAELECLIDDQEDDLAKS